MSIVKVNIIHNIFMLTDRQGKYSFTVFAPTYNRAHTLHRVYESLLAQTDRDFEWLVVDDGSNYPLSINLSNYLDLRTFGSFLDFNSGLKCFPKLGHVGNSQDTGKVGRNSINSCNQSIASLAILCAKSFIYD